MNENPVFLFDEQNVTTYIARRNNKKKMKKHG
jgi:hypothetical protein